MASSSGEETVNDTSVNASKTSESSVPLEYLREAQDWVQMQAVDHDAALRAAGDARPSSEDCDELLTSITDLQKQLQEASVQYSIKELLVRRLQLGKTLMNVLFTEDGSTEDQNDGDSTKKHIVAQVEKQKQLVSCIIQQQKETEKKREELDKLKEANFELMRTNREAMAAVKEKREATETKQQHYDATNHIKTARNKLEQTTTKLQLVKQVFQGLVVGSGINWAQDGDMMDLVIELGTPLDV